MAFCPSSVHLASGWRLVRYYSVPVRITKVHVRPCWRGAVHRVQVRAYGFTFEMPAQVMECAICAWTALGGGLGVVAVACRCLGGRRAFRFSRCVLGPCPFAFRALWLGPAVLRSRRVAAHIAQVSKSTRDTRDRSKSSPQLTHLSRRQDSVRPRGPRRPRGARMSDEGSFRRLNTGRGFTQPRPHS